MMSPDIKMLCDRVRQTAYDIHVYLGHGHLEKIYENALSHRLEKVGIQVFQQHPLQVTDEDGHPLGDFLADFLIENCLIAEIKACRTIAPEHEAQLLGYLRAARIEHGLLINFGSYRFKIKKYALTPLMR